MKLLKAKDVFETNKLCYFYSKIVNLVFVTITKNKKGENYESRTSKWDYLRFIIGLPFSIFIFYDTLSTTLQIEKRSIIFEIILSLNAKIQTVNTSIIILHFFLNRFEYFKIYNTIYWIDYKVSELKLKRLS